MLLKEQKAKIKSNVNSVLVTNTNQPIIANEKTSAIIKSGNKTSRLSRRSKTIDMSQPKVEETHIFLIY